MSARSARVGASGVLVTLLLFLAAAARAGAPIKFAQAPPEGFRPLDQTLALETGPLATREPQVFNLGTGIALGSCPAGAWTGKSSHLGLPGGTIEFEGQHLRCLPFGAGTATYPNGARYTGTVNSYLRHPKAPGLLLGAEAEGFRLHADSVRIAVREGKGTATNPEGKVFEATFLRGEVVAPDKLAGRNGVRIKAFDAALAVLAANARAALESERRAALKQEDAAQAARAREAQQIAAATAFVAGSRAVATRAFGVLAGAPTAHQTDAAIDDPCGAALAGQRRFFDAIVTRRPADAAPMADLRTARFMAEARVALLDRNCPGPAGQRDRDAAVQLVQDLAQACGRLATTAECVGEVAW